MNYRDFLLRPLSKHFVDRLAEEIFLNTDDFELVYQLIFDDEITVAWRAAWACQKISEKMPLLFSDDQFNEIAALTISTTHQGLKRGCLSVLNNLTIPRPLPVDLLDACYDWMISAKSAIAVQALSLRLLQKFCEAEPDLIPEMMAYLENFETENLSPGMRASRRNVIKSLSKISRANLL